MKRNNTTPNIPTLDTANLSLGQNPSSHCLIIVDDKRDCILSQLKVLRDLNVGLEDVKVFWLNSEISAEDKRTLLASDIRLSSFENIVDLITELKDSVFAGQKVHMLLDMEMPANDLLGRAFKTSGGCIFESIIKHESLRQAMKSGQLAITVTSSNSMKEVVGDNKVITLDDGNCIEICVDDAKKQIELLDRTDQSIIKFTKAQEPKLGTQSRVILSRFSKSFEDDNPDSVSDNIKRYPHMFAVANFIKEMGRRYRAISVESDGSLRAGTIEPNDTSSLTTRSVSVDKVMPLVPPKQNIVE